MISSIALLVMLVVHPGNTLSGIAAAHGTTWQAVWSANPQISNPNLIYPGQVLTMPRPGSPSLSWHRDNDGDSDADDQTRYPADPPPNTSRSSGSQAVTSSVSFAGGADPSGQLTRAQVGMLWLEAGGPAWAETSAENVALCESGWNTRAYNPSGASGIWQILGAVLPGSLFDALTNARNAVAKFTASGDTWAQWVCQP